MDQNLDRRFLLGGLAGAAGVGALAAIGKAGPLNPPAGAVASSGKTINEAEPRIAINSTNTPGDADSMFRIAQAGGYYLTGNLLVTSGKNGIEVGASGVTIDLNGFQIAFFGGLKGITAGNSGLEHITVRNGIIRGGTTGIDLKVASVTVENVAVEGCSQVGIDVGVGALVTACTAAGNTSAGIDCETHSIVERCTARDNGGNGFQIASHSRIDLCTSEGNGGSGYSLGGSGVTATRCTASGNVTGFNAGSGSVQECTASANTGTGISTSGGSVLRCTVRDNGSNGIYCFSSFTLIEGNECTDNAANGIYSNAGACRIVNNACFLNATGIKCEFGSGHLIGGNVCGSNNLNWSIAVGSHCLVIEAAAAAAVSGNSGGTSPGSTSAWANFTI